MFQILSRPGGRLRPANCRLRANARVLVFQSSAAPEDGCDFTWALRSPGLRSFNP